MNSKEVLDHGMPMYRYRRCRCDICCAAMRDERRKYRKKSDSVDIRLDPAPLIARLQWGDRLEYINNQTIARWLEDGIDVYLADFWCMKFGWHPAEVFGSAFYQGCFDKEMADG